MPRIGNVDTMDAASVVTGEVMNEDQVELRVRDELAGFPLTSPDHEKPKQSNRPGSRSILAAVCGVFSIILSTAVIVTLVNERMGHHSGQAQASQPYGQLVQEHLVTEHPIWQGPSIESWYRGPWRGYTIMREGKGYAPTPMGQVHYRDIGPRNCKHPIVLLHQSPVSMMEWGAVQNALAKLGVRAITIDTPGFGMSDLPPTTPSIAEFADNLIPVLDHLHLNQVVIAGHFTGAQIAASFGAKHQNRVVGVVLHGIHGFTEEQTTQIMSRGSFLSKNPKPDGSHMGGLRWDANATQARTDSLTLMIALSWMAGPDIGHYAAYHYSKHEMEADLTAIQAPGFLIADDDGILPEDTVLARQLRTDFEFVPFSDTMFSLLQEPERWARTVAGFLRSLAD